MKKEIIVIIIIILAVVIGNIITQNYTKECISVINDELSELKKGAIDKDENLKKQVNDIQEHWDNMQEKLAFYIEHDELEKVETQIFILKGNTEAKLYKEMLAEIEKCSFILEHIADKTTLNIKNIF